MVSGGYGANNFREKAGPHNMSKFMLCRRCGKGAHPVEVCPAKVGDRNSLGMVITASPEEFVQFTRQHFEQRRIMRGRGRFNGNPRGGFSAGGSRGGGRGNFTPRYNTVNAVGEDAENQADEQYEADEDEQYDDPEVVASIENNPLN